MIRNPKREGRPARCLAGIAAAAIAALTFPGVTLPASPEAPAAGPAFVAEEIREGRTDSAGPCPQTITASQENAADCERVEATSPAEAEADGALPKAKEAGSTDSARATGLSSEASTPTAEVLAAEAAAQEAYDAQVTAWVEATERQLQEELLRELIPVPEAATQ